MAAMAARLHHRGPDSQGLWQNANHTISLGHQRLAIIDLSPAGHQPMHLADGRYTIVFNGEIYNFRQIRETLVAQGVSFSGRSDTEVLLNAFAHWGLESTVTKLQGMFAFAIWDELEQKLTLCRDRMGEKPLYYGWLKDTFVFASELSALEAVGIPLSVDQQAISTYLHFGYVSAPSSIYSGIYKLPPACWLELNEASLRQKPAAFNGSPGAENGPTHYWNINQVAKEKRQGQFSDSAQAIRQLDRTLQEVISDQMISDVPLGCFLSGGIDSTTVAAVMNHISDTQVETFTIGFDNPEFNEAPFASRIAEHLGTRHNELYIGLDDCLDVAPSMGNIYDEPLADSSQIPTFLVSKMARSRVTVCLSGDGGDELFGGYNRYYWTDRTWKSTGWLPIILRKIMASLLQLPPPGFWDKSYQLLRNNQDPDSKGQNNVGLKIQKLAEVLACKDPYEAYRLLVSYWRQGLLPIRQDIAPDAGVFNTPALPELNFLEQAMLIDQQSYLPGDNLTKVDRASMANSLETRLPLLNHKVVEFAWQTPMEMKRQDGKDKWLLRQVLYQYVPREMIERPKMGFSVPIAQWLRGPLQSWANDLIENANDEIFNLPAIRSRWSNHCKGDRDESHQLWALLMLLSWSRSRNQNLCA